MRIWTLDEMDWCEGPDDAKHGDIIKWGQRKFRVVRHDGSLRVIKVNQQLPERAHLATQPRRQRAI